MVSITTAVTFFVVKNRRILATLLILLLVIPVAPIAKASSSSAQSNSTTMSSDPSNVLRLPMNEGVGNLTYDCSSNNNDGELKAHYGTRYGASWVYGKLGKALDFENDQNNYVSVYQINS